MGVLVSYWRLGGCLQWIYGVSLKTQALSLISIGQGVVNSSWGPWPCSAASVCDGWLMCQLWTLTSPSLPYPVASLPVRLQLAPCFTLCLPWCTWREFRLPPSPYGGEIEVPSGHGDRGMPKLGEAASALTSSGCAWPNPVAGGKRWRGP